MATFSMTLASQALVLTAALAFPYLLGHGLTDFQPAIGPMTVILLWSLLAAAEKTVQQEAPLPVQAQDTRWRSVSLYLLWLLLPVSVFDARFSAGGLGAGSVLMMMGGGLRLWSLYVLGPLFTWTTGITAHHSVVRHGPYRYLKHPNYIGNILFASGIVVATTSLAAALLWVLFVGSVIQTARHEERYLKENLPGYS